MPHTRLLRATLLATSLLGAAGTSAGAQEASPPEPPPQQPSIQILPAPEPAPTGRPDAAGEGPTGPAMGAPTLPDAVEQASATPAFRPTTAATPSPYGTLADIQACPYKQIRAAYDEAVTGKDVLDTLAVEREILILCDERNTLVAKLLEGEDRLADLLTPDTAPTVAVTGSIEECTSTTVPLDRLNVSPDQATETAASSSTDEDQAEAAADPQLAQSAISATAPPAPAQCEPLYATRYVSPGSAEAGSTAQAGITDTTSGTDLTVKVGDILTGGYVVKTITNSGVTLSRDNQILPLPGFDAPSEAEGFYAAAPSAENDNATERNQ